MKTKNILTVAILTFLLVSYLPANAQKKVEDYKLYTTVQIKPMKGKAKEFEKATLAHIEKFHKEGIRKGGLRQILTGSKSGSYVWVGGPNMFSDFDNIENDEAHNKDWAHIVENYIHHIGHLEHWKMNSKLSFTGPDAETNNFLEVWIIDVTKGEWEKFTKTLGSAVEVSRDKGEESMHTYNNSFGEGDGRDLALVFGFEKWSDLDIDDPFKDSYIAKHGEGSWEKFVEDWESSTAKIGRSVWKIVK